MYPNSFFKETQQAWFILTSISFNDFCGRAVLSQTLPILPRLQFVRHYHPFCRVSMNFNNHRTIITVEACYSVSGDITTRNPYFTIMDLIYGMNTSYYQLPFPIAQVINLTVLPHPFGSSLWNNKTLSEPRFLSRAVSNLRVNSWILAY